MQALLPSFFRAWPSGTRFALLLINLVAPPTIFYIFQPSSLAPFLFINFSLFQPRSREFTISP